MNTQKSKISIIFTLIAIPLSITAIQTEDDPKALLKANFSRLPQDTRNIIFADIIKLRIKEAEWLPQLTDIEELLIGFKAVSKSEDGTLKDNSPASNFIPELEAKREFLLNDIEEKLYSAGLSFKIKTEGLESLNDHHTPLGSACAFEKDDVVRMLLNHGSNINAQDQVKWTAAHWAGTMGNISTLAILLKHGADVTLSNISQETPLSMLADKIYKMASEAIDYRDKAIEVEKKLKRRESIGLFEIFASDEARDKRNKLKSAIIGAQKILHEHADKILPDDIKSLQLTIQSAKKAI